MHATQTSRQRACDLALQAPYFDVQANAGVNELTKRLKQSDHLNVDLQRRLDELTNDLQNSTSDNQRLTGDLTRVKVIAGDIQQKLDQVTRENKQLLG